MSAFRRPYTVIRRAPGEWVNGRWVEGADSRFTISASVQPARPEEVERLPEGRRKRGAIKLYTDQELIGLVEAEAAGRSPDRIPYRDQMWEVVEVEPRQSGVIDHYKVLATRMEPEDAERDD